MFTAYTSLVGFVALTVVFICVFNTIVGIQLLKFEDFLNNNASYKNLSNSSNTSSVCPHFSGRLGNQMFIFASSYAVALSKGMTLEVQEKSELYKTFRLTVRLQSNMFSRCHSNVKIIEEKKSSSFDRNILQFDPLYSVSLRSYLQSYVYFTNYSMEIRRQYVFREHIQNKALNILKQICNKFGIRDRKYHTMIGVHVRRGDMVSLLKKENTLDIRVASSNYLLQVVTYFF